MDDFDSRVDRYLSNGWRVVRDNGECVVLGTNVHSFLGHFFVFLFTAWFTLGFGNVLYFLMCSRRVKIWR